MVYFKIRIMPELPVPECKALPMLRGWESSSAILPSQNPSLRERIPVTPDVHGRMHFFLAL